MTGRFMAKNLFFLNSSGTFRNIFLTTVITTSIFYLFAVLQGHRFYPLLGSMLLSRIASQLLLQQLSIYNRLTMVSFFGISLLALVPDLITCLMIPEMEGLETGIVPSMLVSFLLLALDLKNEVFKSKSGHGNLVRTLFYGHHENDTGIISDYMKKRAFEVNVVGLIDDSVSRWGKKINGVLVLGGIENVDQFIEMTRAEELVIVTDRLEANNLKIALKACLKNNIVPRLVGNDLEVDMKQDEVKDFELAQLLNRSPVDVDMKPVAEMITGHVVMVTGGGGSIGSELCRQIIKMKPHKLIIVDHSELNLYAIDSELQSHKNIHSLLIDVKDNDALTEVFIAYRPQVIYHAAAYKHVHLVEKNPYPSIINNIQGTKNLIECALEFGIKAFVLISTDKAVNPSSIMGSTKRVCELMVTKAGQLSQVRFCSVRFGNVLGSSGSLVPLLKKQVRAGGPVTVTDPKMTRYFMLIPEAVKLVLKAGQISSPGDLNILRMGEPVKIMDLARKVIALKKFQLCSSVKSQVKNYSKSSTFRVKKTRLSIQKSWFSLMAI